MAVRPEYASVKVAELAVLPRFPMDQDARIMVLRTLVEMIQNAGRAPDDTWEDTVRKDELALDWLIQRAVNLWSKWEGIRELRAIYCARYRPADGIETTSALYIDGVPPDPAVPRLALPAPADLGAWPKEELEQIGKAWAQRNKLTPAQQRRQEMVAWLDNQHHDVIVLSSDYDDAMIGIAVLAADSKKRWAVYDYEALLETVEDKENLTPNLAAQLVGNLFSEVLLFYRPPNTPMRAKVLSQPVTQAQIDQAVAVARARREGWTPERLTEIQAEITKREKADDRA